MKSILILNGPNLNLLGQREPETYGHTTLADVEAMCKSVAAGLGLQAECAQSNLEGELIEILHEAGRRVKEGELIGVVFNPGAYTHTSVALHDAIAGAEVPVVECHISNVHKREQFRHHSFISPVAIGVLAGFGVRGYELAIRALAAHAEDAG
ncbi:type II 3-dehydroquinate dehydratase [Granulosicoccaceae sp. 1_MG-2023]|nr:type II 3-dehydroquinate dehydratase [Granulosicoccaceae sp. 1_MG-2023]